MAFPRYYSSLKPFQSIFRAGLPALTYHHVGPRKRNVRLKGLYVSTTLFAKQIAELSEAGLSTTEFGAAAKQSSVALTFDDGFRDVFENALPILNQHRFSGIQFLVSDLIGKTNEWQQHAGDVSEPLMDERQVREWLSAGQKIGSHTKTHPWLSRISGAEAREQIHDSKKSLEDRFGVPVEHFCYPYGDWDETVRDLVIEAGYKTACTTISGINAPADSLFELKRFTARYPTRKLRTVFSWLGKNH